MGTVKKLYQDQLVGGSGSAGQEVYPVTSTLGVYDTDNNQLQGVLDKVTTNLGLFTCITAAATAAKTVSASKFVLMEGGSVKIKFTYANSSDSPTLAIGTTAAKPIIFNGSAAGASNSWGAGEIVEFFYDGANWVGSSTSVNVSQNTLITDNKAKAISIGGTNYNVTDADAQEKISQLGQYEENPEFVEVHTDADGKVLYGVKSDGDFYIGAGVPSQIDSAINEKLEEGLETKVDKDEGKSLIDADYAASKSAIENPEYLDVTLDAEDKVLEGIKKDGTKVIGGDVNVGGDAKILGNMELSGVSYKVVENPEYLAAWVDAEGRVIFGLKSNGKTYIGDADFLTDIKAIKAFLPEEINMNIDWDALSSIATVENPEFVDVEIDADGKILSSRGRDGVKHEEVGFETPKLSIDGASIDNIEDPEGRTEILTDSEGKVLSYRDCDGVKHEEAGVATKEIYTDAIKLSDEGMTEFQQALKDAGFQPGGSGDYTDKNNMYIPEPRLAHLNIITDFDLTTLTKTSDVKCQVEFTDSVGNYFKKWVILNGQGRSSLDFMKKGLGVDFFNEDPNAEDFDEDNTFSMKFGDWVPQDSFHIKSYYTDWPRCTTPVVYKLADEVFRTRGILKDRPYKKYYVGEYSDSANANTQDDLSQNMETGAKCVPDGFPVIVYQNGEFWGVNAWQLKKHRDNYMLSKKKATNIHLDGDMGITHQQEVVPPVPTPYVPFWLWDGNINWAVFCSGRAGIEIRNPKNLYCVDGKKYDADTHDAEIITSATAEEWIASGQITPTGKVIDDTLAGYLRATGKVRESIEDLTTYVPTINRLISGGATAAEIRSAIENIFDIDTFIDYIVIGNVVGNNDAWDNNGQIITWGKLEGSDRLNWSVNVYDCDITFGCQWDGRVASAADNTKLGLNYPLYKIFWDYYFDELKTRYHELRDKGIFTAEHITQLFRNWMSRVGYDNYSKEYDKWNESPCFRDGNQTYPNYPTTGGMYGSIYRIYNWIKKRIEYMDANDFFDYSQN